MGEEKKYHDKMYTPFATKDVLDALVDKICKTDGLLEETVRDLLSKGWMYQGNKWVKHGKVAFENS